MKDDTVDGSEIWRSPVQVGSLSPYIRRVLAPSHRCFFFLPEISEASKVEESRMLSLAACLEAT